MFSAPGPFTFQVRYRIYTYRIMSHRSSIGDKLIFATLVLCATLCVILFLACPNPLHDFMDRDKQYTLTVSTAGVGRAACASTARYFVHGTVITLNQTPGALQYFGGWSGKNGAEVYLEGGEWKLLMDGDKTVTATFTSQVTYTLSVDSGGYGAGTVSLFPPGWVYYAGTAVTLTAGVRAGSGCWFDGWSGANAAELGDAGYLSYSVTMDRDKAVTARFEKIFMHGGEGHSLLAAAGGAVWAWGDNGAGQLGLDPGATSYSATPVRVSGLSDVVGISANWRFGLALSSDGSVWAWGNNDRGQLGVDPGATPSSRTPVRVSDVGGAIAVGTGVNFGLAVLSDGTVRAWGDNGSGQLGANPTVTPTSYLPIPVSGITGAIAVDAGDGHSLALLSDGTVRAWGDNRAGQLGMDPAATPTSYTPIRVSGLSDVVAVAAGFAHSIALRSDGTVWAWGGNDSGALGLDPTVVSMSWTPVCVSGLTGVVAVAANGENGLALRSDGTVWVWGWNGGGQLGVAPGAPAYSPTPLRISGLSDVAAIAAGAGEGYALRSDGTVWAWGLNNVGQLGNGKTTDSWKPVQVNVQL